MISITQGDALPLTLICKNHDLTGATVTTIFPGKNGHDVVIPSGQHAVDADQTANKGKVVCTVTATDTVKILDGDGQNMITKVVQSGTTIHFHGQGILTVRKPTLVK
jgi:hypothetical protein